MSEFFYGGSQHAVLASKVQIAEHANQLQEIISRSGHDIELVAVNKYYKGSCVCRVEGRLHNYTIYENMVRREYEFRGYGGDVWEQAPNLVQLKDLELGQMELF
ncbi:hypothetical protein FE783_12780 [Paenibacillus mesophilus]|uniref:hypothetical protein n=1 Tax=Paenibacillus mesophilus TaxID=2582849 RepID=UPI00110E948E|nr:hypothetical protein [Paenibacillus mesophilus]TMV49384.1 hypothetical protein FE783_12780 [Paenibacillus mesophilus]